MNEKNNDGNSNDCGDVPMDISSLKNSNEDKSDVCGRSKNNERSGREMGTISHFLPGPPSSRRELTTKIVTLKQLQRRQKAYKHANFYTECHLRKIPGNEARDAAMEAKLRYDKWWHQKHLKHQKNLKEMVCRSKIENCGELPHHQRVENMQSENAISSNKIPEALVVSDDGRIDYFECSYFYARANDDIAVADSIGTRQRHHVRKWLRQREILEEQDNESSSSDNESCFTDIFPHDDSDDIHSHQAKKKLTILKNCPTTENKYDNHPENIGITDKNQNNYDVRPLISCVKSNPSSQIHEELPSTQSIPLSTTNKLMPSFVQDKQQPNSKTSQESAEETVKRARCQLLQTLLLHKGDVTNPHFKFDLKCFLQTLSPPKSNNYSTNQLNGKWFTLSKPNYINCLGSTNNNFMYTLGRMSFDMFQPCDLQCSIQGIFNSINSINPGGLFPECVPEPLIKEIRQMGKCHDSCRLRTYNIVTAFTIEPNQTRNGVKVEQTVSTHQGEGDHEDKNHLHNFEENGKDDSTHRDHDDDHIIKNPVRGIMTNYGYALPDPNVPNRLSIWFTGGCIEVNDNNDLPEWKNIFTRQKKKRVSPKQHNKKDFQDEQQNADVLASRILLGAKISSDINDENGTLSYILTHPIGGHGVAYCDVLYMDDTMRIMRGHGGTLYVFGRV